VRRASGGITPQQAADLLNVSQRFVLDLVAAGEIPSQGAGTHALFLKDVLAYRSRRNAARGAVLGRLTLEAQDLGIYED
jgi:excisionase family DNA binding protein